MSCKVDNDWFELEFGMKDKSKLKYKEFLKKEDDFALKCSTCDSTINVISKGFAAVTQNLKRNKHIENMEVKFNKNQSEIEVIKSAAPFTRDGNTESASAQVRLFIPTTKGATTKSELLLLLNGLSNNCSFKSFDNFGNVLQSAFKD